MHTVKLLLKTTTSDKSEIEKRFHACNNIHNTLVRHARKLLRKLDHNTEYQLLLSEYKSFLKIDKEKRNKETKVRMSELSKELSSIRKSIGLSEACLQSYIKKYGKQFSKLLSSQQIQKEATRVWKGVERILFSDGEELHFKEFYKLVTIGGKSNTNGVKFSKENLSIEWMGLHIRCKYLKGSTLDYISEALSDDISYCEIKREMFPNGYHYYVIVYLKGESPSKNRVIGDGKTGIDPGTSTMATTSDISVRLFELAPDAKQYEKKIIALQRSMDRSKRISNPNKFNLNGTIKKENHDKWVFSKHYIQMRNKLRSNYRKKSIYIKQSHEIACNELLKDSRNFIVEKMNYKALQKRSKKTEKQEKPSEIKNKDGTTKVVYKYKKKKRFGRSLNNRSPGLFLTILKRKAVRYGGTYTEISTKDFKASQYNHVTDSYEKTTLSERFKIIDGNRVQRDLYSSFLIKNTDDTLKHPDRNICLYEFDKFVKMQDEVIKEMKLKGISMKQCFGF